MTTKTLSTILLLLLCLTGLPTSWASPCDCVQTVGRSMLYQGKPFRFKAINFSNYYYLQLDDFNLLTSLHHDENDFKFVKQTGFNSIRLSFNGNWYLHNPEAFFTWLDRNVSWAKKHELLLILDLHVPVGGDWLSAASEHRDFSVWEQKTLRQANISLWRDIASRYHKESTIAAYQLMNEPVLPGGQVGTWIKFIQDTIDEIRKMDKQRLIIVDPLAGIDKQYFTDFKQKKKFFTIFDDANVAYDLHFYDPFVFTHYGAHWANAVETEDFIKSDVSKQALLNSLLGPIDIAFQYNVPVVILEFGIYAEVYRLNKTKALAWVENLLQLLNEYQLGFAYWNYHGADMGLFLSTEKEPPADPNDELIGLLARYLRDEQKTLKRAITERVSKTYPQEATPPGGLEVTQVPQFVIVSFDDNLTPEGVAWAEELFNNQFNSSGLNNGRTYDGLPARASFFMTTYNLAEDNVRGRKLSAQLKQLWLEGHELGNHTHTHLSLLDQSDLSRDQVLTRSYWRKEIQSCNDILRGPEGIKGIQIHGFRAPYLIHNSHMFGVLHEQKFTYDSSLGEGLDAKYNGKNYRWPYRLSELPRPAILQKTADFDAKITAKPAFHESNFLWELPNYYLVLPNDEQANQYGIEPGLVQRVSEHIPYTQSTRKLTPYDYNLWHLAKLNQIEVLGILKYNLDLRLEGNRAPLMLGLHSQYYGDTAWAEQYAEVTVGDMRWAIREFLHYALSKPEVRVRPGADVIRWMENPAQL